MVYTREKAIELLNRYLKNKNLVKHCIASGVIMRALAIKFGRDKIKWELAGLLHDIDVELTKEKPQEHTKKAVEILTKEGLDNDIIEAIKMHNSDVWGYKSDDFFHIALRASETVTGLIVAAVLVLPDKKLSSLTLDFLLKRFNEKRFAQGARRDIILECEKLGITLPEFLEIAINAMKELSVELGI